MIGSEVGSYRVIAKIGAGGMGVVYKAVDTHLDRVVAIKALNPEFSANPSLLERFRREARAQARLNHTNIATLYAFLVENGVACMVMEFVDGETLHAMLLRRGPIPASEAVPLFRQALAGIGHAHGHGIVHRDIKPNNIMFNRDGVVKVMDFGLAKAAANQGMTQTGTRVGTAFYMSPEQVLSKPVDARSDIYSLGVTLYEILTAQTPFQANSDFQVLDHHVNSPPMPPSRLHPIPGPIEQAVLKALAKSPEQRYQTVEEFSAALEQPEPFDLAKTVIDMPAMSLPTQSPVQATQRTSPVKLLAIGEGVLACLLVGWLIFHFRSQQPVHIPPQTPPVSVAPAAPSSAPIATESPGSDTTPQPQPAQLPPASIKIVVPAGTRIFVRTVDPIEAKTAADGQEFPARLLSAVTVNGREAFHAGDLARLALEEKATLRLASITTGDQDISVSAAPFLVKAGFLRKKRVAQGTHLDFTLTAPVTITLPPG